MNKQIEKACDCSQALRRSNLNQFSLVRTKDNNNASNDKFKAQLKRVYEAFDIPSSMLQISVKTGILRANICRYVAVLERQCRIQKIREGICPISKHKTGFYTSNEALFHNDKNQLKLF